MWGWSAKRMLPMAAKRVQPPTGLADKSSVAAASKKPRAVVTDSPFREQFEKYGDYLNQLNDKRERIVKASRDVTMNSKKVIFQVHRVAKHNKELVLEQAERDLAVVTMEHMSRIAKELQGNDFWKLRRAYSPGVQEYIEAATVIEFCKTGKLLTLEDLNSGLSQLSGLPIAPFTINLVDYLLGVGDLTGELMRLAISRVADGEVEVAKTICNFVRDLYRELSLVAPDIDDSFEMNKKMDTMLQSLVKIENDQMRRNREVALMQLHNRNLGYGLQGNAASGGVCVAGNGAERDFLSCGLVDSDGISNCQVFTPLSEVEALITARFQSDCCLFPNFQEVQNVPQNQGHIYILSQESRIQNLPYRMLPQANAQELQLQDFHYFVVIDFEATCDMGTRLTPQEIIEFPAVLVNGITGRLEGHFQTYVKPNYHPVLTDFCKELTGIHQSQVDGGVSLSEALLMHDTWLDERGIKNTNFVVVTWSDWDCKVMLESECNLKGIRKPPYFNRWINLKVPFYGEFGELRCNLKGAVQSAGLEWEGRAHCGLDDAKNTARLLVDLMRRGIKLSITNSFNIYASDGSKLSLPKLKRPKAFVSGRFGSQASSTKSLGNGPISTTIDKDKDVGTLCFCGVRSNKCMVKKPGPRHGSFFFACGNWTITRGALCEYFEWAAPDMPLNA